MQGDDFGTSRAKRLASGRPNYRLLLVVKRPGMIVKNGKKKRERMATREDSEETFDRIWLITR